MHPHRFRVISALMSFAVALSTVCVAQSQGVVDPNAPAVGQNRSPHGRVMSPASSIAHPGDRGIRARTHLQVFMPEEACPFAGPPFAGLGFETPASLACVYSLVPKTTSCNPNVVYRESHWGIRCDRRGRCIPLSDSIDGLADFFHPVRLESSQPNCGFRNRHQACAGS